MIMALRCKGLLEMKKMCYNHILQTKWQGGDTGEQAATSQRLVVTCFAAKFIRPPDSFSQTRLIGRQGQATDNFARLIVQSNASTVAARPRFPHAKKWAYKSMGA